MANLQTSSGPQFGDGTFQPKVCECVLSCARWLIVYDCVGVRVIMSCEMQVLSLIHI